MKVAHTEEDIAKVLANLTMDEKVSRIKAHYDLFEVLEIMGYYDGPGQGLTPEKYAEVDKDLEHIYFIAAENGNFEEAIAYNNRFSI
jgi:hypothetical protein